LEIVLLAFVAWAGIFVVSIRSVRNARRQQRDEETAEARPRFRSR
jgi:hypothetical protein